MRGRRPYIDDKTLLALYVEQGTIEATTQAAGYVQSDWIRRRLRKAGMPPGKPGRPRKEGG